VEPILAIFADLPGCVAQPFAIPEFINLHGIDGLGGITRESGRLLQEAQTTG
jgi:hypothetical protein